MCPRCGRQKADEDIDERVQHGVPHEDYCWAEYTDDEYDKEECANHVPPFGELLARVEKAEAAIKELENELETRGTSVSRTPKVAVPLNVASRFIGVQIAWLREEVESGRIPGLLAGRIVLVHIPTVLALLTERAKGTP